MLDATVIVVGGGPGGSAVAKRCAEHGLETILLEKKKLPRDKVCGGGLLPVAEALVTQEFGEIPREVLNTPPYLAGNTIHVPGVEPQNIEKRQPQTWRKDLDYWMNQKVKEVGGQVWDRANVTGIREEADAYIVELKKGGKSQELKAKFVIGADGATSVVRKFLFPDLKVVYGQACRECYEGEFGLNKEYSHVFFSPSCGLYMLALLHKEDYFVLEWGSRMGEAKKIRSEFWQLLAKDYGFDSNRKPLWKDACLEPALYRELFSGSFTPARGNVLLVGDAAGLLMPITGDGISPAMKSGLSAAAAVIKATEQDRKAEEYYLPEVNNVISRLKEFYVFSGKIMQQASTGGQGFSDAVAECWKEGLKMF